MILSMLNLKIITKFSVATKKETKFMVKVLCYLMFVLLTFNAISAPKTTVKHQRNAKGFAQIQVINATMEKLICHVAIDGHKIKFRLMPLQPSQWYTATDTRFNYKSFSVWCDYLDLHPESQEKTEFA